MQSETLSNVCVLVIESVKVRGLVEILQKSAKKKDTSKKFIFDFFFFFAYKMELPHNQI